MAFQGPMFSDKVVISWTVQVGGGCEEAIRVVQAAAAGLSPDFIAGDRGKSPSPEETASARGGRTSAAGSARGDSRPPQAPPPPQPPAHMGSGSCSSESRGQRFRFQHI